VCYCPAADDNTNFGWYANNAAPNQWPISTNTIHGGYDFNPYINQVASGSGTADVQAFTKIAKFPKTFILSCDVIDNSTDMEHFGQSQIPSWNVLFVDGHVTNIASLTLYKYFAKWGSTNGSWGNYENVRYCLETLAAGGDLNYATHKNGTIFRTSCWNHSTGESNGGHPAP
jgi:hypothetical protein